MFKLLIIFSFIFCSFSAHAQPRISGFLGLNSSEFDDGDWDRDFGVELGVSYVTPLSGNFYFRSGAGFVQKNSEAAAISVKFSYIEIPLTIMYQANSDLALFAGLNFDIHIDSSPSSVSDEEFVVMNLPLGARFQLQGPHSVEAIMEFGLTDMASPPGGSYSLANSLSARYLYTF